MANFYGAALGLSASASNELPPAPSAESTRAPSPSGSSKAPNHTFWQGNGVQLRAFPNSAHPNTAQAIERLTEAINSNTTRTAILAELQESQFKEIKEKFLLNEQEIAKKNKFLIFNFISHIIYNRKSTTESGNLLANGLKNIENILNQQLEETRGTNSLQSDGNRNLDKKLDEHLRVAIETKNLIDKGNESRIVGVQQLEKANGPKPAAGPVASYPDWIANITRKAAHGLAGMVKDTPWAKDILKGFCHFFETMHWLVGLGLSLTLITGAALSLPTMGVGAIGLLAFPIIGKHFMACLRYELDQQATRASAPIAAKDTTAKIAA